MSIEARCFVRVCSTDDALWVCDLPRHEPDTEERSHDLERLGFSCRLDPRSRLWYVDWTQERWKEMLAEYPQEIPAFPVEVSHHAAYALCRLWMSHPGKRTQENLPLVRRVLKLADEPEEKFLAAIPALYDRAAEQLREGIPSAFDAGRILAFWLNERSNGK